MDDARVAFKLSKICSSDWYLALIRQSSVPEQEHAAWHCLLVLSWLLANKCSECCWSCSGHSPHRQQAAAHPARHKQHPTAPSTPVHTWLRFPDQRGCGRCGCTTGRWGTHESRGAGVGSVCGCMSAEWWGTRGVYDKVTNNSWGMRGQSVVKQG